MNFANILRSTAIIFLVMTLSGWAGSQAQENDTSKESGKSLAEIAKEAKKNKAARAAKVVTEDDLDIKKGPLPKLNLEGPENFAEIIEAIGTYKSKHTDKETEDILRDWYDEYDSMLKTIFRDNQELASLRESTSYHGYEMCQEGADYYKCRQRQQTEIRGKRHDQAVMRDNFAVANRIQTAITRIGEGMNRYNLRYEWWKVRYINSTF